MPRSGETEDLLPDEQLNLFDPPEEEEEDGTTEEEIEASHEDPDDREAEGDNDDEGSRPESFEEEEDPDPEPQFQPQKPSRSKARIRELANRNRDLQRQIDEFTQGQRAQSQQLQRQQQFQDEQRRQAEYRQWYEGLDATQRYYEDIRVQGVTNQRELHALRNQMFENNDRQQFQALLADNPHFKQYEAQVEDMYRRVRADGVFASRDLILNQILGQAMRQGKKGKPPVDRKAAERRVAAAKTKPPSGGGDTPRGGRRPEKGSVADLESRLKGRVF